MEQVNKIVNIKTNSKLTNHISITVPDINKPYKICSNLIDKNRFDQQITYKHSLYHYTNFL